MIGYYIHHSGYGHLARACSIAAHIRQPVTALTSTPVPSSHPFADVVILPRDDTGSGSDDPTAQGLWHWAPQRDSGLRQRMRRLADWVDCAQPSAIVVDVSVEVAAFARLMGVPIIVMAVPGERTDVPHTWVYQLADHILAAWPRELYEPSWLRIHRSKTSYVGGISRFDGRDKPPRPDRFRVAVLGCAASSISSSAVESWATDHPGIDWSLIGLADGAWVADPWAELASAHVVIAHAGQGSVADLAAASAPAIVVPQPRPFDEQHATATVLADNDLAVTVPRWPERAELGALIQRAAATGGRHWSRWQSRGAAKRAAAVIDDIAASRDFELQR